MHSSICFDASDMHHMYSSASCVPKVGPKSRLRFKKLKVLDTNANKERKYNENVLGPFSAFLLATRKT